MKISVTVKANAKQQRIEKADSGYIAYVKAPPMENKANKALIKLLSEHFNIPKSNIGILRGKASKHKIVEVS